ncbi:hypothetical protein [Pseudoduganella sp. OTU4001]|uniref:hypothetical protein n=1 Tax=Pseudoduganella sp. OTU4001 TaxID=3043854 RepID=UPI00313E519F
MDTEIRLVKVEQEVDTLKVLVEKNSRITEDLRHTMDRRFSDEHAWAERQFAEIRKEMSINFRWLLGIMLTGFTAILGILGRIGGLY